MKPSASCADLKITLKMSLVAWLVLCVGNGSSAATSERNVHESSFLVRWEPLHLVNGSPIFFQIKSPLELETVSGRWMEHDLSFSLEPKTKTWIAIAGASLETRPGKYPLLLTAKTSEGKQISFARQIAIGKGKYRRIELSVPKQFTEPNSEQLVEIKQEKALKQEIFSRIDPQREWEGNFIPPVTAAISDVFGTTREFNGETQSMHQGIDYAVPSGTPVAALNRGIVLLARPLFFEGNCVVLDHGQGLLSLYMHLSKLEVKEGDRVTKGEELGLSGGTGRATGPHLHIALRWQGIYVNPTTLLSLRLP